VIAVAVQVDRHGANGLPGIDRRREHPLSEPIEVTERIETICHLNHLLESI
jgi:hypothetical protein